MKNEKKTEQDKATIADAEYRRLTKLFTEAGVDKVKLDIYTELIHKVAEVFASLEKIKNLPSILYDKYDPAIQRETAAGKMRVKYMAQYTSAMQKLNKDLLGGLNGDDGDDLADYE